MVRTYKKKKIRPEWVKLLLDSDGFVWIHMSKKNSFRFFCTASKYNVQTKIVAVDFTSGREIYQDVGKQLDGLEIGVLVNNVGMSYPYPQYFHELEEPEKVSISRRPAYSVHEKSIVALYYFPQRQVLPLLCAKGGHLSRSRLDGATGSVKKSLVLLVQ